MITHFLGLEEVKGYARDIADRLSNLAGNPPSIWCPIGYSGDRLASIVGKYIDLDKYNIQIIPISFNKHTKTVGIDNQEDAAIAISRANSIFVIDSSVHSGSTMLDVVRKLESLGARQVLTYSLIIKQSTKFIPHFFGVLVGDNDRTLFLLDSIPNNRLFKPNVVPSGIFRAIAEDDCSRSKEKLDVGVESIDKITWADLVYQKRVHGHDIYVIEIEGKIASYIGLKFNGDRLLVDVVATDKMFKGKGLGGALLRWAETLARSRSSSWLELWAISDKVEWYKNLGFNVTDNTLELANESYTRMTRKLLYSFDLKQMIYE